MNTTPVTPLNLERFKGLIRRLQKSQGFRLNEYGDIIAVSRTVIVTFEVAAADSSTVPAAKLRDCPFAVRRSSAWAKGGELDPKVDLRTAEDWCWYLGELWKDSFKSDTQEGKKLRRIETSRRKTVANVRSFLAAPIRATGKRVKLSQIVGAK